MTPNDWEINQFLRLTFVVILIVIGSIGLGAVGFNFQVLRWIFGFIFLTFIPGILVLRILRIHNLDIVESIIYSVGLSIAFIYALGLFSNYILPIIGVAKPIALTPLIVIIYFFVIILCVIAYFRDRDFNTSSIQYYCFKDFISPVYIICLILIILTIFGTYYVNMFHCNIILLLLISLIAITVGLVSFNIINPKTYPILILTIAISLLLQQSLISPSIYGSDITMEYYLQHIVLNNGFWNASIPYMYNNTLSIVILAPIYSIILSADSIWLFKILYPLFFSLTSLVLYQVYKERIGATRSILAVFFFLAIPEVIPDMISHGRQEIGEVFFALFILLIVSDKKLSYTQKSILAIIFMVALVMSHYTIAYILILVLSLGLFLIYLLNNKNVANILQKLFGIDNIRMNTPRSALNITMLLIMVVLTMTWTINVGSSSIFNAVVNIGINVFHGLADFFTPGLGENVVASGLGIGFFKASLITQLFSIFQYVTELSIIIGLFVIVFYNNRFKFKVDFIVLVVVTFIVLLVAIVLPHFSGSIGFSRLYHISSYLLAPLFVLGAEEIVKRVLGLYNIIQRGKPWLLIKCENYMPLIALLILIPYFLFASGFVYAFGNQKASIALGPFKIDNYGLYNQTDIDGASWLWSYMPINTKVYGDATASLLLRQKDYGNVEVIQSNGKVPMDAYMFLRSWNIQHGEILVPAFEGVNDIYADVNMTRMPQLNDRIYLSDSIYENGGARMLAQMAKK